MFRFLTAGESHGALLSAIVEGLPAGVPDPSPQINRDLQRRQQGYGRGKRMSIERDQVEITAGIIRGKTYGAPLALHVKNSEFPSKNPSEAKELTVPRPGHADLAGARKYNVTDVMPIWERSSARETAMRVAVGGVAKTLLSLVGIEILGYVRVLGGIDAPQATREEIVQYAEISAVRSADPKISEAMCQRVDEATAAGDTLGGMVEVVASHVPIGLGSMMHWDRRLDSRLARHLMSIPAAKAVAIGDGIEAASLMGSQAHDRIQHNKERGFYHPSNHAGGVEGGMSNGEELRCQVFFKPIPTLRSPLPSVDLVTLEETRAPYKRSDVCVVPAAAVVCEAMVAIALAEAFLDTFYADTIEGLLAAVRGRP